MVRATLLLSLALLAGCAMAPHSRDGIASYDFGLPRPDKEANARLQHDLLGRTSRHAVVRRVSDWRLIAGDPDPHREYTGGEEAVVVAECVGDGFDAGVAGGGGVGDRVGGECHGAVGWVCHRDDGERVQVGIEIVLGDVHPDRPTSTHHRHIITCHWWLVGVSCGEDSDLDGCVVDVSVGVDDEVVDLMVGVDEPCGVGGRVGEPGGEGAGEHTVGRGLRDCHYRQCLPLGVGVVGQQLCCGDRHR